MWVRQDERAVRRRRAAMPEVEGIENRALLSVTGLTAPAVGTAQVAIIDARKQHRPRERVANPAEYNRVAAALEYHLSVIVDSTEVANIGPFRKATIGEIETSLARLGARPNPAYASFIFSTEMNSPATETVTVTGKLSLGHTAATAKNYTLVIVATQGQRPHLSTSPE
jgi:hypothetical protein